MPFTHEQQWQVVWRFFIGFSLDASVVVGYQSPERTGTQYVWTLIFLVPVCRNTDCTSHFPVMSEISADSSLLWFLRSVHNSEGPAPYPHLMGFAFVELFDQFSSVPGADLHCGFTHLTSPILLCPEAYAVSSWARDMEEVGSSGNLSCGFKIICTSGCSALSPKGFGNREQLNWIRSFLDTQKPELSCSRALLPFCVLSQPGRSLVVEKLVLPLHWGM